MSNYFLSYQNLQRLIEQLKQHYRFIGPQVRDAAIVYDHLDDIQQLPWGVRDVQRPGEYRLEKHDDQQAFAWANGPQAVKPELFKPRESLWQVQQDEQGQLRFKASVPTEKVALFGIRPCDLHALKIQDKVFLESDYQDHRYQQRRENVFLIVANCSCSSGNCFCLTADGHPQAKEAYDVAVTEIDGGFVADVASQVAQSLLSALDLPVATQQQLNAAAAKVQQAVDGQTKKMATGDVASALTNNPEHPRWQQVADRCLSCGNCTQVCPTCFCHREADEPSLDGQSSEHVRQWDSCFSADHSYIHGLMVRKSTKQRYRQWLTHKLGTWHQQFGTSGCVGCGRCISWCPVGIDITEEVAAIKGEES